MKKKISVIFALLACLCLLASCGQTTDQTYGGKTADDLKTESVGLGTQLAAMSKSDLQKYYKTYATQSSADPDNDELKVYKEMFKNFVDYTPELGEFKGFGDFKVDKAGKNITTTLTMKYSKRDATFVMVFKSYNMAKPTSINFNPVYTLGETMGRAALNCVMGLAIVFVVLIIICLVIYAFNIIPYLQKKHEANKAQESGETAPAAETVEAEPSAEEDSEELIAVISAAISAATGASTDSFVVRSIKRRY